MTKTTKRMLFLRKFNALVSFACLIGIDFIVTCFYRNGEEQHKRWKEGKSTRDGYEKKSAHQNWLAIDIAVIKNGKAVWGRANYELLGQFWLALGGIWDDSEHGKLDDPYHFEYR